MSDHTGQLRIDWNRRSEAVIESQMGYLEVTDGSVPIQIELDPALLQTGSVYYSRTSSQVLVRMMLVTPTGQLVEESVPFVGAPPPVPVTPPDDYATATSDWSAPEKRMEVPVPAMPPAPAIEDARDLKPEPPAPPKTAAAERFQSRTVTRAARRLSLPAAAPVPDAPSQIEPPELLAQPGGSLRELPYWPTTRSAPVPDQPATRPAPVPDRPAPAAGRMIWTGKLERRGVIEIQGGQTSVGHLSGGLPGAPAVIEVFPGELVDNGLRLYVAKPEFANRRENPGPQNGWNATEYVWDPARSSDIRVLEPPDQQNGWKHLVLRAENRSYAVIVVRWLARKPAGN